MIARGLLAGMKPWGSGQLCLGITGDDTRGLLAGMKPWGSVRQPGFDGAVTRPCAPWALLGGSPQPWELAYLEGVLLPGMTLALLGGSPQPWELGPAGAGCCSAGIEPRPVLAGRHGRARR